MVEHELPKLDTTVRFRSPAPCIGTGYGSPVLLLVLLFLISGCTTTRGSSATHSYDIQNIGAVQYHTVREGETLWKISKNYGVDLDDLIQTNGLSTKGSLEKGQVLTIPGRAAAVKPKRVTIRQYYGDEPFMWPVRGTVLSSFGERIDKTKNKGLDIRAAMGQNISASRSGVVVFIDDKLKGFGKTVIIDHGENYQSVYAYNSQILVSVGDSIKQGQIIARAGNTGRAKEPSLHFEIRKNGEPRNPYFYLKR